MKKVILSLLILFAFGISQNAQAQKAYIEFENTIHDYGTIKEANGPAVAKFTFKNTGKQPLVLTEVKPNCGCTSPEWSKAPIQPGATGFIKASYDPKNRPGVFNKNIKVVSNAENQVVILRIKGDVIARERGINDIYPMEMGPIRVNTNHIALQRTTVKEHRADTFLVYNSSDAPVKISFQRVPGHITMKAIPETLKPKGKGQIAFTYDAGSKGDWGFVLDRVPVVFNDVYDPKKRDHRLTISADLQEDFSHLTVQDKAKAPKIEFESLVFDFGTLTQGESASSSFKFKNTGKSDLLIRKVKTSCGCTAVAPEDKLVPAGGESKIDVTFRSRGKKGKQNKTITVITNDPINPSSTLKVTGTINLPSQK
jgi:hypothetical protein